MDFDSTVIFFTVLQKKKKNKKKKKKKNQLQVIKKLELTKLKHLR